VVEGVDRVLAEPKRRDGDIGCLTQPKNREWIGLLTAMHRSEKGVERSLMLRVGWRCSHAAAVAAATHAARIPARTAACGSACGSTTRSSYAAAAAAAAPSGGSNATAAAWA
jgi:hypothetical protein